jgi:hypothetical protein
MTVRARSHLLLAVILPALVLRALIPFGFMPVAGSGGPALQLCSGVAAMAGAPSGHQHHHGTGSSDGSVHALCAFAASAAPAVTPAAPAILYSAINVSCAGPTDTCGIRAPSILRAQSARAPPSLA